MPLAGGTVTFYIPGTTTPKDTWQNSAQTILNSNPVTLDSAGRAIIYGSGSYRQIVRDSLGNLIWDQETSEPNSGSVSFGGTSAGTANAQTLTSSQFSFIDGQIISFIAGISNTGATTMSIGGSSPIPVYKNDVSGPVNLASGDLVAGNSYFIQYSATLSAFQLLLSIAPATPSGTFLKGYLYGLTMSNAGGDPVNDITISAGSSASDGASAVLMTLSSPLTKRIDANWAVGNNNGWLDTGVVADGVYHAFQIQRSDTGIVDSIASLSPTTPTMPANYDRKRRIGSIIRRSGSILAFTQVGDQFILAASVNDVNVTNLGAASVTYTLTAPTGVVVEALFRSIAAHNSSGFNVLVRSLLENDQAPASGLGDLNNSTSGNASGRFRILTNTSAQVAARSNIASTILFIWTYGWVDTRGRLA